MKKFLLVSLMVGMSSVISAQLAPHERSAEHIANKMKESLQLTPGERGRLYSINVQLHQQKNQIRGTYSGLDTLGLLMQKLEIKRDSLYKTVLQEAKYQLYMQKRRVLITSN